jgi:16S rRNA pseudouridine516 synthase
VAKPWVHSSFVDLSGTDLGPMKDALPLMPGVRKVLDRAHARGLRIGLGTGNTLETVRRRLGRHDIFDRFDAVVTRAEVTAGKPAPDIYLEVARRLAVLPELRLVLEDSVHGCEAALAAGMRVIACPSVVTEHCHFPTGVELVSSQLQVAL